MLAAFCRLCDAVVTAESVCAHFDEHHAGAVWELATWPDTGETVMFDAELIAPQA